MRRPLGRPTDADAVHEWRLHIAGSGELGEGVVAPADREDGPFVSLSRAGSPGDDGGNDAGEREGSQQHDRLD